MWTFNSTEIDFISHLQYSQLSPASVWALNWTQCSALYDVAAFLELSNSNDGDIICNMSSIYGHGLSFQRAAANRQMKTEQNGGLVCESLTMDLLRIWRKTHLSKPKMKLHKKLHLFSLCICLSWDLPVSSWDHEIELKTVSLTTKLWG